MDYEKILSQIDLNSDDTLLVSSNMKPLALLFKKYGTKFIANDFIDILKLHLKDDGTLLFPSFNYGFSSGKAFDYKTTPPENMGTLSNTAFKRDDFIRTKHPVFSFFVWGKYANEFYSLNNKDAFSIDSPFGLMYNLKAKMLFIDIDYNRSFTYVHFVEQMEKAFYRYHKKFQNEYIDENGIKEMREYSIFVRDLEKNVKNNYNPLGQIFEDRGIAKRYQIETSNIVLLDLHAVYEVIKEQIKYHPENLVTYTK